MFVDINIFLLEAAALYLSHMSFPMNTRECTNKRSNVRCKTNGCMKLFGVGLNQCFSFDKSKVIEHGVRRN